MLSETINSPSRFCLSILHCLCSTHLFIQLLILPPCSSLFKFLYYQFWYLLLHASQPIFSFIFPMMRFMAKTRGNCLNLPDRQILYTFIFYFSFQFRQNRPVGNHLSPGVFKCSVTEHFLIKDRPAVAQINKIGKLHNYLLLNKPSPSAPSGRTVVSANLKRGVRKSNYTHNYWGNKFSSKVRSNFLY